MLHPRTRKRQRVEISPDPEVENPENPSLEEEDEKLSVLNWNHEDPAKEPAVGEPVQQVNESGSLDRELNQIRDEDHIADNGHVADAAPDSIDLQRLVRELRYENADLVKALERSQIDAEEMKGFQDGEIVHLRMHHHALEATLEKEKSRHAMEMEDVKMAVQKKQEELDDMKAKYRYHLDQANQRSERQDEEGYRLWSANLKLQAEIMELKNKIETELVPIYIHRLIELARDKIIGLFPECEGPPKKTWNEFVDLVASRDPVTGVPVQDTVIPRIQTQILKTQRARSLDEDAQAGYEQSKSGALSVKAIEVIFSDSHRMAGYHACHPPDLGLLRQPIWGRQDQTLFRDIQELFNFMSLEVANDNES